MPSSARRRSRPDRDRGAAAVEMALLLPVLLVLVFGIIDFGRALNEQITLTSAAREGARLAALGQSNVVSRTQGAAAPLTSVSVNVTACAAGSTGDATVVATHTFTFITPVGRLITLLGGSGFSGTRTMTGRAVLRCQG
jgi:Flp pilus assembly protein TadG